MSSQRKTDALIKDLARLFITYSRTDWQPILDELERGSHIQMRLAGAVQALIDSAPSRPKKRAAKRTNKADRELRHPERAEAIAALGKELRRGELLPTAGALREAFHRTGAKKEMPKSRSAAISAMLEQLDQVPTEQYQILMAAMLELSKAGSADFEGDYARWFSMILDRPAGVSTLRACHFEVLSIMDRALIRGARSFSDEDSRALRSAQQKWLRMGGTPEKAKIIDRFLQTTALAGEAPAEEMLRLNEQVVGLKAAWGHDEPKK